MAGGCVGVRRGDDGSSSVLRNAGGRIHIRFPPLPCQVGLFLSGIEVLFVIGVFLLVGTLIVFTLIGLELFVASFIELFREVVEVIGGVCRPRFLPAAVAISTRWW